MQILITSFLFVLGSAVGSFLNVLAERGVRDESIRGRSYCENCQTTLAPRNLIPIISYLLQRGKCNYCQAKLSPQYLAVELVTGISFALTYWLVPQNTTPFPFFIVVAYYLIILSALIALFITDFKYGILLDRITIPTIIFVVSYQLVGVGIQLWQFYTQLSNDQFGQYLLQTNFFENRAGIALMPLLYTLAGSLGIALFFLMLIIITKGRGMGGGDVKLGLLIGLIAGWPGMLAAIMIGFLTGSLASLILISIRRKRVGQTIPFGPFLIIGCIAVIFFGDAIINWYLITILGLEPIY